MVLLFAVGTVVHTTNLGGCIVRQSVPDDEREVHVQGVIESSLCSYKQLVGTALKQPQNSSQLHLPSWCAAQV